MHRGIVNWGNNLKVLASFMVILLHIVSAKVVHFEGNSFWHYHNFLDSLCRPCVPLFVMLTGSFLLKPDVEIDRNKFLKKRLIRILLPFVLWSVIYIVYNYFLLHSNKDLFFLSKFLTNSVLKQSYYHLWYIYMLIGLYLFIPIINPWLSKAKRKDLHYFLIIWLFSVLLINDKFVFTTVELRSFSGYLGYMVFGYYLFNFKPAFLETYGVWTGIALFIAGLAITYFGVDYFSNVDHVFDSYLFYNNLSLNVIMMATGLYLIFQNAVILNKFNVVLNLLAVYSYGIYLSHILMLILINTLISSFDIQLDINEYVALPLKAVLCLILSFSLTYLINLLPYGKFISGKN